MGREGGYPVDPLTWSVWKEEGGEEEVLRWGNGSEGSLGYIRITSSGQVQPLD